jgi:hypothetical protein
VVPKYKLIKIISIEPYLITNQLLCKAEYSQMDNKYLLQSTIIGREVTHNLRSRVHIEFTNAIHIINIFYLKNIAD